MRRRLREEQEERATASRSVEQEGREVQTPPRTRADVAPLSAGVIAVAVVDLVFAVVNALGMLEYLRNDLARSLAPVSWRLSLVGFSFAAIGTLMAAVILLARRQAAAQAFQAVGAVGGLLLLMRLYRGLTQDPVELSSTYAWQLGMLVAVLLGMPAYAWWLTRRNGEG